MKAALAAAVLAGVMLAVTAWTEGAFGRAESAAQVSVSIGVDADPTGNTATSLGPIDSCVSVSTGDTFQVDLFVTDVADLLAWEAYFVYDIRVINITKRDVLMFQAANPDSQVFDVSEALPDIDGRYRVAAADIAEPPAPDSGSGVLARLTLKAVGPGVSTASLPSTDVNGDGTIDLGPFMNNLEAEVIGDLNGDSFFDGPISNATIAVDMACPDETPGPSPTAPADSPTPTFSPTFAATATPVTPSAASPAPPVSPTPTAPAATPTPDAPPEGEETTSASGPPWMIAYVAGGVVAVVLLGGGALLVVRRRRAR